MPFRLSPLKDLANLVDFSLVLNDALSGHYTQVSVTALDLPPVLVSFSNSMELAEELEVRSRAAVNFLTPFTQEAIFFATTVRIGFSKISYTRAPLGAYITPVKMDVWDSRGICMRYKVGYNCLHKEGTYHYCFLFQA
jgi:hypothetical protein